MTHYCVCGGSTDNPNPDCERCDLRKRLADETRRRIEAERRADILEAALKRYANPDAWGLSKGYLASLWLYGNGSQHAAKVLAEASLMQQRNSPSDTLSAEAARSRVAES